MITEKHKENERLKEALKNAGNNFNILREKNSEMKKLLEDINEKIKIITQSDQIIDLNEQPKTDKIKLDEYKNDLSIILLKIEELLNKK